MNRWIKRRIYKWLLKDLNSSYDSPNTDLSINMHDMWEKHEFTIKKLMKIHKGNCIEKFANTKEDAELIREITEGLEVFILLYYNTVKEDDKRSIEM